MNKKSVEQRIQERIKERLDMGLQQYGPWNLNDSRYLKEEALQELLDATIYITGELLKMEEAEEEEEKLEKEIKYVQPMDGDLWLMFGSMKRRGSNWMLYQRRKGCLGVNKPWEYYDTLGSEGLEALQSVVLILQRINKIKYPSAHRRLFIEGKEDGKTYVYHTDTEVYEEIILLHGLEEKKEEEEKKTVLRVEPGDYTLDSRRGLIHGGRKALTKIESGGERMDLGYQYPSTAWNIAKAAGARIFMRGEDLEGHLVYDEKGKPLNFDSIDWGDQ